MEAVECRDGQIQCPINPAHLIRRYKLAGHLIKCRRSHPHIKRLVCPFNTTHIIEPAKFEYHVDNCPSSGNVRNALYVAEPQLNVGVVPIEQACTSEPVYLDEDWNGDHPTYDPINQTEARTVTRVLIGASKSERKAFKKAERERLSILEKLENPAIPMPYHEPELEVPLRLPKCTSKARAGLSPAKAYQDIKIEDSLNAQFNKLLSLSEENKERDSPKLKNKTTKTSSDFLNQALAVDDNIAFGKPEAKSEKTMKNNTMTQTENKENSDVATVKKINTQKEAKLCENAILEMTKKDNSDIRPLRKPKILLEKEKSSNTKKESVSKSNVELNCSPLRYMLASREKDTRACVGRGFALLYNNYKVWEDCEVNEDSKDVMNDYAEKYGYEKEI